MKVGILYNYVEQLERGVEQDSISDNEILSTVRLVQGALGSEHEVIPVRAGRRLLSMLDQESFDIVFNICEGFQGNVRGEAYMAGFLDLLGIPYTGSDPLTLSLCLDKGRAKEILRVNGIPTPAWQVFEHHHQPLDPCLAFPLIVKPLREDASVGIDQSSVVNDDVRLRERLDYIIGTYRQPALAEEYVEGRELNVAILGNIPEAQTLPISEILFDLREGRHRIVDYGAKWLEASPEYQGTKGVCPADLDHKVEEKVRELALKTFKLLGCKDYARVDFRLGKDGPVVLEVNPNPGINKDSGFARSAMALGLTYDGMIRRILENAVTRYKLTPTPRPVGRVYESEGIRARSVGLCDIPDLVRWFNDACVSKFMQDSGTVHTEESLIESFFVKVHDDIDLIIEDGPTGRPIGFFSIYDIDTVSESAEISFLIGDEGFRGKGVGKAMANLAVKLCFQELALNRVTASVTVENRACIKALEAAGFRRAGLLRDYQAVGGLRFDESIYEMLREDLLGKLH